MSQACPTKNNPIADYNTAKAIKIARVWAMPNKWTFTIKPIAELLNEEINAKGECWCDPFAGENSPAGVQNDINPDTPAKHHFDALTFLKTLQRREYDGVLYDPPYSITQARMYGKKEFSSMKY